MTNFHNRQIKYLAQTVALISTTFLAFTTFTNFRQEDNYKLRVYKVVDKCWLFSNHDSTMRQFICIEISKLDSQPIFLYEGAYQNSVSVFDSLHNFANEICFSGYFKVQALFLTDAFNKLKGTVSINFNYGYTPWASFKIDDINKIIEPLDTNKYNSNAPLADSIWYNNLIKSLEQPEQPKKKKTKHKK